MRRIFHSGLFRLFPFLFILASILALLPSTSTDHNSGATASELQVQESVDGAVTTTSYVDSDGAVTDAIDIGYATVQRTRDAENRVKEERYFDAKGHPVKRYSSYYGIAYEYGEGRVKLTFLDAEGAAAPCAGGYAVTLRTLDAEGRAQDDFYYDLDQVPAECTGGYYGLHREYDAEGRNSSITYLGQDGQAVCIKAGYATRTYERDADGSVVAEYYFDPQGHPIPSSLGEYGQQYERDEDGRVRQITYVDANGDPMSTTAGYTMLKRTYYRDGTAEADLYFDADGQPIALAKGQYGVRHNGNVNLLLDKNGHVMLCVDNLLNGFPVMVVVIGCIVCALQLYLPRKMSMVLTIAYVVFIFYETLMFRETGEMRTNLVLFSYADRFWKEPSIRAGVVNNVWLFIPLGTGLYRVFRKKWVLVIPFLLSVAIEMTQYVTGLGIAEFDDVFGNTLGGLLGIAVAYGRMKSNSVTLRKRRKMKENSNFSGS